MKRLISFVLFVSLMLSLMLPAFAEDRRDILVNDVLSDPVAPQKAPIAVVSKRSGIEDNHVFPGPLCKGLAVRRGESMTLPLVGVLSGKTNQYACILIYKGKGTNGELLYTDYEYIAGRGYQEISFTWDCRNQPIGAYTVVTCTAEPQGNSLVPIAGTAYAEYVYIIEGATRVWHYFIEDWETGEHLESINMSYDQPAVIAWGRSPKPSYDHSKISPTVMNDVAIATYVAGLFILQPVKCGWGELRFYLDNVLYSYPINVCVNSGGHNYTESIVARESGEISRGVNVHYCDQCNQTIRELTYTKYDAFRRFMDLDGGTWYFEYVKKVFYRDLFNGVKFYQFKPEDVMTRAMLVTVLWRYAGQPDALPAGFTDVPQGMWYSQAVAWAAEHGIVNGVGSGKFDPNGVVTREQLATILYRYTLLRHLEAGERQSLEGFKDVAQVNTWSVDALKWAVAYGLITGSSENGELYLRPQNGATRAQVSAILIRFIENLDTPVIKEGILDLTDAVDFGEYDYDNDGKIVQWAYYGDGTLRFAGSGKIPKAKGFSAYYGWERYRTMVRRIEVLNSVEGILEGAFAEYSALESVQLADTIEYLDAKAFSDCSKLKEIHLSEKLSIIGKECFLNCSALQNIDLPDGLDSIKARAFENCTSLKEIVLPNGICYRANTMWAESGASLEDEVFSGCTSLETVTLPIALNRLPSLTFKNCTALKYVELPLCVEELGDGTFYGCESLEVFVIPETVDYVPKGLFTGCTSLETVFVLNPYLRVGNSGIDLDVVLDDTVFGDPQRVTVYGFLGETAEQLAKELGYTYKDIEAYLNGI